jgi:O-antigen ligase
MAAFALASAAAALVTISWNGVRVSPGVALCDALLALTALFLLVRMLAGHDVWLGVPGWAFVPGYVLLSTGLVYALYSGQVIGNAVPALRFAVALTLTPIVLAACAFSPRRRDTLIDAWLLGAAANCLAALADFVGVAHFGEWVTGVDYALADRFSGLAAHPNHLAIAAAMAIPVAISRFSSASRQGGRNRSVLYATVSVVLVLGVLMSGSRAGLVVGIIAAAAMVGVPLRDSNSRLRAVVLVAATLLIVMIAATKLAGGGNLFIGADRVLQPTSGELASNTGRQQSVSIAVSEFAEHPIMGVGFSESRSALNIYLQLLQAGGILGLAAFAAALGGALRACIRLARGGLSSLRDRHMAAALSIALLAWLVFGLVQNPIYDRFLYVPMGFALALLSAAQRERDVEVDSVASTRRASARTGPAFRGG